MYCLTYNPYDISTATMYSDNDNYIHEIFVNSLDHKQNDISY